MEGKEEESEVEGWGERSTSVDISDDVLERTDAGAYERHQMERRRLQAKQQHSERRKAWLRKNQALLRVFLSYCSLHGAKGGGVTSVRMELLFLLQESQQVCMHLYTYVIIYVCFLLVQNSLQRRQIHFLSYSVGDHSEAAAVPFASAYYTAPVICLHCPHQDSHSQPCSPPQQSHTRHPLHHHTHGDPTTSGHHGRSGQYFKNKSLTSF